MPDSLLSLFTTLDCFSCSGCRGYETFLGLSSTKFTCLYCSKDESRFLDTFSEVVIELGVDIDWLICGFELIFVVPFSASNCFNFDSFSGENPTIGDNGYLFLDGLFSSFELRLHSVVF